MRFFESAKKEEEEEEESLPLRTKSAHSLNFINKDRTS